MTLYKNIAPFIDYLHSIRKIESILSFDMMFPTKWGIPKSISEENKVVSFETGNPELRGMSFVCEISDEEINKNVDKILKTIKLNIDREVKEKLFKETVEKLKKTFETNDLEKLKNITIGLSNPKKDYDEQDPEGPTTLELAGE